VKNTNINYGGEIKMLRKTQRCIKSLLAVIITAVFCLVNSALSTVALAASENIGSNIASNIWIVGDSTVSSFTDNYYYPRYGWGTQIGSYLDGSFTIQNLALSGRSSKSYIADPQYQALLSGMKNGDYLLVGFGHNDEKAEAERYTNPNGTYLDKGSFANSLYENYIKPAQAAGTKVILCTPIVRRVDTGVWSDSNLHITATSGEYAGGDYPQAIRDLGKALSIPVVDMTSLTKALYDKLGPTETVNLHAWTSSNPASVDNTHTNIWGGKYNAYLITKTIKELGVIGLAEHVIDASAPTKTDTLVPNPNYKESTYSGETPQSALWKDYGIWKGTAFGDIGGNPSTANQILETDKDGNMHIAVLNNKGKISSTSDGLAMYYYKVPANSTFTLTAKAKVNKFDLNDQVSFGLMARDAIYIDSNTKDSVGDYVAAAPYKVTKLATGGFSNCFARKSGVFTLGGTAVNPISAGDTVNLCIQSNSDGYACTFGNEATITGGFDFKLTSIDQNYVYVGMFAARNADVTFSNIKLVVDGVEVTNAVADKPAAPTGLTAVSSGTDKIDLNWTASTEATGYNIYRSASENDVYTKINSTTGSAITYSDTGLAPETDYYYKVTAVNASGESAMSPSAKATTTAGQKDFDVKSIFSIDSLQPNKILNVQTTVTNNKSSLNSVLAIVALYDGNDRMVNMSYVSKNIILGNTENFSSGFKLPSDVTNYKVKVFVWDGTGLTDTTMQPLSNVVTMK
jgi:lysophospholipase L1-like esterase